MSAPTGEGTAGGAPPPVTGALAAPAGAAPPAAGSPTPVTIAADPLADHDDGLLDAKEADPPWVKRLRTQGANYRTRARAAETELAAVKTQLSELQGKLSAREAAEQQNRVAEIAKRHGLWDHDANDKKGGLLPGVSLGSGTAEEMEAIASGLATRISGRPTGGNARRPASVAATTSGTSDSAPSGTGRAAQALRDLMGGRTSTG